MGWRKRRLGPDVSRLSSGANHFTPLDPGERESQSVMRELLEVISKLLLAL